MKIHGLDARSSDLARGIVIVRSRRLLDAAEQAALIEALADGGLTEVPDDERAPPPRRLVAAPWAPPARDEVDAQEAALQGIAEPFDVDAVWLYKVETAIDGVAWAELVRDADAAQPRVDGGSASGSILDVAAELADPPEVVYSAPELLAEPSPPASPGGKAGTEADDDDDDDDASVEVQVTLDPDVESHWRNGPPPTESSAAFPVERFPEILEEYDWDDVGLAIKLTGAELPGEESVVNAFFALWLSVYQDERAGDFEVFRQADVVHDRTHRSALLWIDELTVPATPSDQIEFLLWIVARLHEIVPVAWARFDQSGVANRTRGLGDDEPPFVLAGNPLAERFHRNGEQAAMAWATAQSLWSRREIAAMLIELAITHDPDEPSQAQIAERLLLRASGMDGRPDAIGYLATVMVRQGRFEDAVARVRASGSLPLRLHLIGETVEHAPEHALAAFDLLEPDLVEGMADDELSDVAHRVAEHAPEYLAAYLARLPERASLVPHLYNASFSLEQPESLAVLSRVLELPEPDAHDESGRAAFVMAWNNACIHAHAIGEVDRACALADGAQRFAAENPYIFHSAACAYAAAGRLEQALAQVKQAIDAGYDHIEKMEVDRDLGPLLAAPEFKALFSDWRSARADLN